MKIIVALLVVSSVIGGIVVMQNEELSQKFFPEEVDLSQFATKEVEKASFKITVEAAGTVDSSRNATLSSEVEGTTTIISIVSAGTMVEEPLRAKTSTDPEVQTIVHEIKNMSSGTPTIVLKEYQVEMQKNELTGEMEEAGRTFLRDIELNYQLTDLSEVVVKKGDEVEDGDILIGDLVCELDSATLVDNEKQQQISVTQAEADLEKGIKNVEIQIAQNESDIASASLAMKLAKLDLVKYQEGEYVQETERIQGEIQQAREELARAKEQYQFTKRVARKGYKSQDDVKADELAVLKAELQLKVKLKEQDVLQDFTKERTVAELLEMKDESARQLERVKLAGEAALDQYKAEVASRKLSYNVQLAQLERLREQIKACQMIAPQAGQVVYAMEASRRSEPSIVEEGMTVRERQKLITLPDMSAMKVDAKIHESKISDVKVGLPVVIRINAIPGYEYEGVLDSVSSVPLPGSWPNYDLKQYEAVVKIVEDGPMLNQLKPGMSANIEIIVEESSEELLQIPVQAVVDVGQVYYAWVLTEKGPEPREINLGRSNDVKFVVENGLEAGEEVITNPRTHFAEQIVKLEAKYAKKNARDRERSESEDSGNKQAKSGKPAPGSPPNGEKTASNQGSGGFDPAAIFARQDKDKNGVLEGDEISGRMRENLSRIDANSDGKVTKAEFTQTARRAANGGQRPGGPNGGSQGAAEE
ncbi:MAG: HlyD family efflux transporter periplasmic adaptor subunit [Planctomycetaceae bacterium]|nr:HlyD family efflux transporter periplasmic adaptor subunit [Planctomycetaceae bacterium]